MNNLGVLGGDEGNTLITSSPIKSKQVPKRKNHFFTINNYTEDQIGGLLNYFNKHATKYAFQEEICPTTGTPHLQGMVMFATEKRSTVFDPASKGHWEKLKDFTGTYQLKEETRKPNGRQWTFGFPKPIYIISELYPWQKEVEKIYFSETNSRSVYWFWESKGNVGKSAFVKYMVIKYGCIFCDGGKKSDIVNLVYNTNMDKCTCLIWDLPRSNKGKISSSTIESVKNGLICNTKYETGFKAFNWPHVFIFSNFPPDSTEELSEDKWIIKNLDNWPT